jgi:hypothetical protein
MASRKNFPTRMEARRLRALERNNRAFVATIPIPLPTASEAAPDFSDRPPVEPTLARFGLSDGAVQRLPKLWFYNPPTVRIACVYLLLDAAGFLLLFGKFVPFSFAIIFLFLAFSAVSLFPFALFWGVMVWAERQLYVRLNPDFARYTQYKNAVAVFEERKREHEARLARQRAEYWRSLSGVEFERELGKLFSLTGYAVSHTPSTADGGVDLLLRKDGKLTVVQCKAHKKPISISVARELFASMMDFKADDAIIACFEGVTKPVFDYIKTKRITVITVNEIIAHQMKYG